MAADVRVDSGEYAAERRIAEELRRRGVEVEVAPLPVGDYYFPDSEDEPGVIVERKTTLDLVHSIEKGRLMTQLARLKESGRRIVLLLEGSFREVEKLTNFPLRSLTAALRSIAVNWGVPVVGPLRRSMVVDFLENLAKSLRNRKKREFALRPSPPREWSLERKALYVIEGFPGIGPAKAREVLRRFGSIKHFVNASLPDLLKIRGLGEKVAREIHELVNTNFRRSGRIV